MIITALNQAWVARNSIFDLFLESFRIGIGTERLLKHVIGVCVDKKAYDRCLQVHPHCYFINATGSDKLAGPDGFLSPGYLTLVWRRLNFLREVISLGYNFIFTVRTQYFLIIFLFYQFLIIKIHVFTYSLRTYYYYDVFPIYTTYVFTWFMVRTIIRYFNIL